MKNLLNKETQGITLIALVITIVILIILAGVLVNLTLGENGLFTRAKLAKQKYEYSAAKETVDVKLVDIQAECMTEGEEYTLDIIADRIGDEEEISTDIIHFYATAKNKSDNERPTGIERIKGILVSANQYPKYKFLIGEEGNVVKVIGVTTEEVPTTWTEGALPAGFKTTEKFEEEIGANVVEGGSTGGQTEESGQITQYTITYMPNGGSGTMNNTTGETPEVASNEFTRENYKFVKWNTKSNGTGTDYTEGTTTNKNLTLYAIWKEAIKVEIIEDTTNLNTSAKVSNISNDTITINAETIKTSEITGNFNVGCEVMLYVSNTDNALIAGSFEKYRITNMSSNNITLDRSINSEIFTNENSQVVKILECDYFVIDEEVTVTASAYDGNCGGIIAIEADKIVLNGKLDASYCGYSSNQLAPNNGGGESSGNSSKAGGSNKYKGGNGGRNHQGYTGYASDAISINNNLQDKRMTFGGAGANVSWGSSLGGGIIYLNTKEIEINYEYALSANGTGSGSNLGGGAAGGTIAINAKKITFNVENPNYFAGANGGAGATEAYNGKWLAYNGDDGTNIVGGSAKRSDLNYPANGGSGFKSNGGGGALQAVAGGSATATAAGNGASSHSSGGYGWNAAGGGGAGGFVSIYTNTDISEITLADATIYSYIENY